MRLDCDMRGVREQCGPNPRLLEGSNNLKLHCLQATGPVASRAFRLRMARSAAAALWTFVVLVTPARLANDQPIPAWPIGPPVLPAAGAGDVRPFIDAGHTRRFCYTVARLATQAMGERPARSARPWRPFIGGARSADRTFRWMNKSCLAPDCLLAPTARLFVPAGPAQPSGCAVQGSSRRAAVRTRDDLELSDIASVADRSPILDRVRLRNRTRAQGASRLGHGRHRRLLDDRRNHIEGGNGCVAPARVR